VTVKVHLAGVGIMAAGSSMTALAGVFFVPSVWLLLRGVLDCCSIPGQGWVAAVSPGGVKVRWKLHILMQVAERGAFADSVQCCSIICSLKV
jgi:hypothetical protein